MIVGSGRGDNGSRKRWAKLVYSEREFNYFLVNMDSFFYPDCIRDVTKNLADLQYNAWDVIITEYACGFAGPPAGASELLKLLKSGGKIINLNGTGCCYDNTQGLCSDEDLKRICSDEDLKWPLLFMFLGDAHDYLFYLDKGYAFIRALNAIERNRPGKESAWNFFTKYKWDGSSNCLDFITQRDKLLQSNETARSEYLRTCLKLNPDDVQSVRLLEFKPGVTHDVGGEAIETYLTTMISFHKSIKRDDTMTMVVITKK